jgi:hypothetical protein
MQGEVGRRRGGGGHRDGAAAERHLALGDVGDGQLFEHVGTVQDGINTLSRRPRAVVDRPAPCRCR